MFESVLLVKRSLLETLWHNKQPIKIDMVWSSDWHFPIKCLEILHGFDQVCHCSGPEKTYLCFSSILKFVWKRLKLNEVTQLIDWLRRETKLFFIWRVQTAERTLNKLLFVACLCMQIIQLRVSRKQIGINNTYNTSFDTILAYHKPFMASMNITLSSKSEDLQMYLVCIRYISYTKCSEILWNCVLS